MKRMRCAVQDMQGSMFDIVLYSRDISRVLTSITITPVHASDVWIELSFVAAKDAGILGTSAQMLVDLALRVGNAR